MPRPLHFLAFLHLYLYLTFGAASSGRLLCSVTRLHMGSTVSSLPPEAPTSWNVQLPPAVVLGPRISTIWGLLSSPWVGSLVLNPTSPRHSLSWLPLSLVQTTSSSSFPRKWCLGDEFLSPHISRNSLLLLSYLFPNLTQYEIWVEYHFSSEFEGIPQFFFYFKLRNLLTSHPLFCKVHPLPQNVLGSVLPLMLMVCAFFHSFWWDLVALSF